MSPILGGIGGVSVRGFGHFPNLYSASYDSIATLTSSGSGVTFSSIPQTYQHLQMRVSFRSTSGSYDWFFLRFNSDTASGKYNGHELYGDGGTMAVTSTPPITSAIVSGYIPGPPSSTSIIGAAVIDILDYKSTSKYKVVRITSGYDASGSGRINYSSGLWLDTGAISSITIGMYGGAIVSGTNSMALYGMKGV